MDIIPELTSVKKALADILRKSKIVGKDSVGQIVLHINNGGITKICQDKWEIKQVN